MNLEVGDKVKVKDNMLVYSTYYEWRNKYVKEKKLKTKWEVGKPIEGEELKDTYTILIKGKHLDFGIMLCYIQNNRTKNCYIIDEKGIELVRSDNMVDYTLKRLYDLVEKGEFVVSESELTNINGRISATFTFVKNKKEILDEVEKEYLSNVIRPFRDKVESISKQVNIVNTDNFIEIELPAESVCLPYFKKGSMYNGMKENKRYSLEELGL